MKEEELLTGLRELDTLAQLEYHQSLSEVANLAGDDDEERLYRIGRLIGVILKEPFAEATKLDVPSAYSRAYRAWELKDEKFRDQNSWQYKALNKLRSDRELVSSLGWEPVSVSDLATSAQFERGFFRYLAVSFRKYLCQPNLRKEIERAIQGARRAGMDLKNVTPDTIAASGGLAIGAVLIQNIPALGMMGAPVIAGIVFIIYRIGIDAFCAWASSIKLSDPDHKVLTERQG